jgi:hypothetical protein
MDLRSWTGVQFIRHAPSKGGEEVELRVSRMKPSHVLWWQSHVQPIIDRDPNRVTFVGQVHPLPADSGDLLESR